MDVRDVLIGGAKLIANPENWTQFELARNRFGDRVNPLSPAAVSFCTYGALVRSSHNVTILWTDAAVYLRAAGSFDGPLHKFNNSHTHAEVCDLFARAIAIAGEDKQCSAVNEIKATALRGAKRVRELACGNA
jgi:hypothetical protein